MAITAGTPGSFPIDFGASEWLSGVLGTQVGAYNPAQNPGAAAFDNTYGTENAQTVNSGGAIIPNVPASFSPGTVLGTQSSTTNNSTSSGSSGAGSSPINISDNTGNIMAEAENAYNAAMGYLDQAASLISGTQAQTENNINTSYNASKQTAETQKGQGEQAITSEKDSAGKRFQNAITAARQALSESLMGGKQRFGRGSDIYKALGEYSTTKFQQANNQTRDIYETSITKLNQQWQALQENFTNTLLQLDAWKTDQLTQAQTALANALAQIAQRRGEAADLRSTRNIQALQDYSNTVNSIASQVASIQAQVSQSAQAYSRSFSNTVNNIRASAQAGAANTGSNAAVNQSGVNLNPVSVNDVNSAANNGYLSYIGQTTKRPEDYLTA